MKLQDDSLIKQWLRIFCCLLSNHHLQCILNTIAQATLQRWTMSQASNGLDEVSSLANVAQETSKEEHAVAVCRLQYDKRYRDTYSLFMISMCMSYLKTVLPYEQTIKAFRFIQRGLCLISLVYCGVIKGYRLSMIYIIVYVIITYRWLKLFPCAIKWRHLGVNEKENVSESEDGKRWSEEYGIGSGSMG